MMHTIGEDGFRESRGLSLPFLFGQLKNIPALPVCVGASDVLPEDITSGSPANGGSLPFSDPSRLADFSASGRLLLDGEWIDYTSQGARSAEGITRAAGGSVAAAHGRGTPIYAVTSPHRYVLGENPGGALVVSSVDAVYINGTLQPVGTPPTDTVTLADGALLRGVSATSLTFAMDDLDAATTSQFITPQSLAQAQAWSAWIAKNFLLNATYPYGPGLPVLGPPPTGPKLVPIAMLGAVTADVTGLLDDDAGTWTGTPNALIEVPADVTRVLLRYAYDQPLASLQDASWAATRAQQVADGLRWALRFTPIPFLDFQRLVSLQGRATLVLQSGIWTYPYRQVDA